MQRTLKAIKFTYAVNELNEKGELTAKIATVEIPETDTKKALKKAFKKVGTFTPLKTETTETLYVLDDEIFFQYAKKVEPKTEKAE